MDISTLVSLARDLLDVGPAEYLQAAAAELQSLIPGDDALWMRTDYSAGSFFVWRASIKANDRAAESVAPELYDLPSVQSYLRKPTDLTPRRDSDAPLPQRETEHAAVRLSQQFLGRAQLSLILSVTPPLRGHGWIMTRDLGEFGDREVATAAQVLPLLLVLDHFHGPTASAQQHEPDERWSDLTIRERQVVNLLSSGLTARAIARVLGISPRTVGKHLENSYRKLGRHDRLTVAVELAAYQPPGLLDPPQTWFEPPMESG